MTHFEINKYLSNVLILCNVTNQKSGLGATTYDAYLET